MHPYNERYKRWCAEPSLTDDLKSELRSISGDRQEIEERFYTRLSFGTGGMRGLLGAGTNRMNVYTIRLVAEGLARFIVNMGHSAKEQGVVIAYDTRHFSKEYALETAKVLGNYGIRSFLFKESRPTPELSFAVRKLGAFAGVVITASHNPAEYNGFKVYGEDGGQLTPDAVAHIVDHMNAVSDLFLIKTAQEEVLIAEGLLTYVLEEIDEAYQKELLTLRIRKDIDRGDLSIVYTPLHGAGLVPIMDGLERHGFTKSVVVKEQAIQDPSFPTVSYPNPEEREAFELAGVLGTKIGADILIATDPDADRLGVAVRNQIGQYELLTGNQLGALLLHYILEQKSFLGTLPTNGVALKTIVTSELGRAIGEHYGVNVIDTLTGFKFISEKIEEFEQNGTYSFLFGYEESYGYLIGDFVRDKDAVQAALVTAEMAAYYKGQGKTLYDALEGLFEKFGFYKEALKSITLSGIEGQTKIQDIMKHFREQRLESIAGIKVVSIEDYERQVRTNMDDTTEKLTLPKADVLKMILEDGSWICVRPSGTEPKCKFYFGVRRDSEDEAVELLVRLQEDLMGWVSE